MPYNKNELMNLPIQEREELAEALWNSIDSNLVSVTKEEVEFAAERLKLHEANPGEGISMGELKNKIQHRYGF